MMTLGKAYLLTRDTASSFDLQASPTYGRVLRAGETMLCVEVEGTRGLFARVLTSDGLLLWTLRYDRFTE